MSDYIKLPTCFLRHLVSLHLFFFFSIHTGPVLEPHEFVARFIASQNGKSDSLGITGRLLAMSIVVWASSFGVDENGQSLDPLEDHIYQYQERKVDIHDQFDTDASAKLRTERRTRTNEMVKEMLWLIDVHGILRKPSWDGVRVLLMILPLAQGERSLPLPALPLCSSLLNTMAVSRCFTFDRCSIKLGTIGTYFHFHLGISHRSLFFFFPPIPGTCALTVFFTQAMYESTINLIYALTSIAAVSSVNSGKGEYVDALVRARIFWSGILHDWMVNGLRGGRMFL